jgi:hypothetical protein
MRESAADLQRLQALLDRSIEQASPFLRSAFEMPQRSLSAEQLVAALDGGLTVALSTVTGRGEPRVAPISAFLLRATFYVPTVAEAARARHLARRPGVSLTYFEGTRLAVIAHGQAAIIGADDARFAGLDAVQVECGNESPLTWSGTGVFLEVTPTTLFTYAR